MRKRFEIQIEMGAAPIEEIKIPLKSRDELPPVMAALKHIYTTPETNRRVFELLERHIPLAKMGRLGMSLWEILVLGVVRLTLDCNYDRLEHVANYDGLVRQFFGIDSLGKTPKKYALQTLKDNVVLLTREMLEEINQIVVQEGHRLAGKKKDDLLNLKVDTYPVKSNVHFPTDINLLWDSCRKSIQIIKKLADITGVKGWREAENWKRKTKNAFIRLNKLSKGGGKNKSTRKKKKTREYLWITKIISRKIDETLPEISARISSDDIVGIVLMLELDYYKSMLDKHIDLVSRRILKDEKIPHSEKVFSIFEPHTEWIQKGKSGNRVDLGLNVLAATDQYGFCVYNHVCVQQHDAALAVPTVEEINKRYKIPIGSVSYDRGFWSPENYSKLNDMVDKVILPKKGRLNKNEYEREHTKTFVSLRHKHAAVESDINSLNHHGLDRCPDRGLDHFEQYVSLGVLAFNLHRLGNLLLKNKRKKKKRKPVVIYTA